ncbi:MAG TPA: helix-turn-helix domain-containing protein [Candidatus Onthousia faecavium]|nr:helix-turn-helix domain-containing protein [Candidatus Onthousia faecavium]
MKELGEYLQDVRRNNGVSLEEAASDLKVDELLLENIESANIRAFKDIYSLKDLIKEYAKYLGLDPLKVQEEFNDFLFEHTSKISLDDIMAAKKKKELEENTKKIQSPYTKEYKRKIKKWPIILFGISFVLAIIISVVVIKAINREPAISSELKGVKWYEYTY